jgi:hypothetical protein
MADEAQVQKLLDERSAPVTRSCCPWFACAGQQVHQVDAELTAMFPTPRAGAGADTTSPPGTRTTSCPGSHILRREAEALILPRPADANPECSDPG